MTGSRAGWFYQYDCSFVLLPRQGKPHVPTGSEPLVLKSWYWLGLVGMLLH